MLGKDFFSTPQFLCKHAGVHYLKEDIRGIVQTHDHCASSYHVVSVGECDEQYGGQVVDEHDHEILPSVGGTERERGRGRDGNSMKYRMIKCLSMTIILQALVVGGTGMTGSCKIFLV